MAKITTKVSLIVEVEHDGSLSVDELVPTVGCWVENIPLEQRTISTKTDDETPCELVVTQAVLALVVVR